MQEKFSRPLLFPARMITLDLAKHYVRDLGLCIIPVPFRQKKPTLAWKPYQQRLPTDTELASWFNGRPSNAAIVCGNISGLIAVDTDNAEAEQWAQEHLPATPMMARTARGIHRFYAYPDTGGERIGNKAHIGDLCLDLRGDGGYVIAPGSTHPSGVVYETLSDWTPDQELPVFDITWFPAQQGADWAKKAPTIQRMTSSPPKERLDVMERARRWMAKRPPAVSGAGGNTATYAAAGKLVNGFALSDQEALEILIEWNDTCQPPWSHEELSQFIENARRYGKEPSGHMLRWLSGSELERSPISGFQRVGSVEHIDTHVGPRRKVEYQDVHVIEETGEESIGAQRTVWYEEVGPDVWGPTEAPGPAPEPPEPWPDPVPLHMVPGGQFPVNALPSWVREYVVCLAESLQVPQDAACMMALPILATCCAKKYVMQMKPDWIEPVNLWVVVSMEVAERKSAMLGKMMAPIHDWERQQAKQMAPLIKIAENDKKILEGKLEKANKAAVEAKLADQWRMNEAAKDAAMALDKHIATMPKIPRLTASDVTPEKIPGLMVDNDERISIVSDEGELFQIVSGRYNDGKANGNLKIESLLKAHSGNPIQTDRISRDREMLHSPALSMALCVQPSVIRNLSSAMRGKGFLARFLYSLPSSLVGQRNIDSEPVSRGTYSVWRDCIMAVLNLPWNEGENLEKVPWVLRLSPEAKERLRQFEMELEPRLHQAGEYGFMADWAGKLNGAVGRVAALLHVAQTAMNGGMPHEILVSLATIELAILIGRYLLVQARLAYSEIGTGEESPEADRLLTWLKKDRPEGPITCKAAWLKNRSIFKKPKDCEAALARLADYGWLRRRPDIEGGRNQKALPTYDVWPGLGQET